MASNKTTPPEAVSAALSTPSRAAKSKGTPNPHRAKGTTEFPKEVIQLYEAIKYGTTGKIDHGAVAAAVGIKKPAARMRHMRLIRKIEASLNEAKVPKEGVDEPKAVVDEHKANAPMEDVNKKEDEANIVASQEKS